MSILRGIKKGHRKGGEDGRPTGATLEGKGYDSRLARQASQPASQPPWHSAAFLSAITLFSRVALPSPPPLFRAHILCPANLPPFARFHSYERRRKGALVVCGTCTTKARRRACLCIRAFFLLGNGGMGAKDRGGDGKNEEEREAAATALIERGAERGRGLQYASERISRIF